MNNLDRSMEFVVAAIFLFVGLSRVLSFRRERQADDQPESELSAELPYWCVALVGLFEVAAAMALITPFELTLFAAGILALSTMIAALYRVSVKKSAAPTTALFLLVLFVICGRML